MIQNQGQSQNEQQRLKLPNAEDSTPDACPDGHTSYCESTTVDHEDSVASVGVCFGKKSLVLQEGAGRSGEGERNQYLRPER